MRARSIATPLAALALAGLPAALAPEAALARPANVAATRAYIRANYALVRAARAHLASGEAAIRGLVREVTDSCPGVAAGSPENKASEQLSNEVVGALVISIYRPDARAIAAFAHAVRGLRWSDATLTRAVKGYATKLEGIAVLPFPNICADVQAWAADGFQALPATTTSFDHSFYAVDVEAEEVPLRLLAPYEGAAAAALLHRTKRLEAPLADAEAHAVENYVQILDGMKLNP